VNTGPAALASLTSVTRRFGEVTALDDVTIRFDAGSIVGLLGPNGAGKSTLLALVQGLRHPSSGAVELFGGSPHDARNRRLLGCTPQATALPETLRVGEVVDFVGAHFASPVPRGELLDEFGLAELTRKQTGALSGGQKRRLSVALAFVGRPRLVLLDEPTTGLDVDARHALWSAIRAQHERGATVVMTSHYLEEIEQLAERVVVIDRGRVLEDDTLGNVLGRVSLRRLTLRTDHPSSVRGLAGVVGFETDAAGLSTLYSQDSDALVRSLVDSGVPFHDLSVRGATLEEAFLTLTEKEHA
jgi:ABC-2 type transport system ATP-binding protein